MHDQKQFIALTSVVASGAMSVMKLIVGLLTGSLGIISEAIHSLLDLVSAIMTFFAVRASSKPPDAAHHYGHGKIEALSALLAMLLLVITSVWIIWEAIHRLFLGAVNVEVTWYAITLLIVVIGIDVSRSRAIMKVAKDTASQALEADAFHYTSDILSSTAVLVGLGMVWLGWPKGDAIAALIVAAVVLVVAYQIGKKAVEVLIDTAPSGIAERIAIIAKEFVEISSIEQIKVRLAGAVIFAEILIQVSRTLTLENVQTLCHQVTERFQKEIPNLDVLVKANPITLENETFTDTVRTVASAHGLSIHDIDLREILGRKQLSFDVEIDENLSIYKAHEAVTAMENSLAHNFGEDVEIITHINPRRSRISSGCNLSDIETTNITQVIVDITNTLPVICGIHHVQAVRSEDGLHIAFHCTFDNDLSLREAHQIAAQLDYRVRQSIPESVRVVIHTEPNHTES